MIRFNCPNCSRPCEIPAALARLPLLCKGCGQHLVVPEAPPEPPAPPPPVQRVEAPRPAPPAKSKAPTAVVPAPPERLPSPAPPPPDEDEDEESKSDFLLAEQAHTPDVDFDMPGPTAAHQSDAFRLRMSASYIELPPEFVTPVEAGSDTERTASLPGSTAIESRPMPRPTPASVDSHTPAPSVAPAPPPKPVPRPAAPKPVAAPEPSASLRPISIAVDVAVSLVVLVVGMFLGEVVAGKGTQQVWNDAGGAVKFPPDELVLWAGPPLLMVLTYVFLISKGASVGWWLQRRAAR